MGRIKFEKINMKIVSAVAVAIILILTVIFIAINTGLFSGKKKDNKNTNSGSNAPDGPIISEEAKERTKPVDELNSAEKKYIIEQNFLEYLKQLNPEKYQEFVEQCIEGNEACTISIEDFLDYIVDPENPDGEDNMIEIKDCNGNISFVYQGGEFKVDMSGVTCKGPNYGGDDSNSNSGSNSSENPIDDSNSNSTIYIGEGEPPIELKNRTKPANQLTSEEKSYVVAENLSNGLNSLNTQGKENIRMNCVNPFQCVFDIADYNWYSYDEKLGYFVNGCTGKANVIYVPGFVTATKNTTGALKIVKDDVNPASNEVRLADVIPHLNTSMVQLGSYVKKEKVRVYTLAGEKTVGALKIVANNATPGANEIRLSSVFRRISVGDIKAGDYVVLNGDLGYILATKDEKNALKVVADNVTPKTNEIKLSSVLQKVNLRDVKVGDYVIIREIDGYVSTNRNTTGALKVVADFKALSKNEIRLSSVRPYLDTKTLKVGDYVTEGKIVADTSKVVCKRG